jgi:hypothetical protein
LIVYNTEVTDVKITQSLFNQLHPQLKFTVELEDNNILNFRDLTCHRRHDHIYASVFRKPTATDTLIHYDTCHPNELKLAGINFLVSRIVTHPIPHSEVVNKTSISQHILNASGFNHVGIADKIKYIKRKSSLNVTNSNQLPKKSVTLTYIGNDILSITRLLKKYDVNITFKTSNALETHRTKSRCNNTDTDISI